MGRFCIEIDLEKERVCRIGGDERIRVLKRGVFWWRRDCGNLE